MIQHKYFAQICILKSITSHMRKVELFLDLVLVQLDISCCPQLWHLLHFALPRPLSIHCHKDMLVILVPLGSSGSYSPSQAAAEPQTVCLAVLSYAHFPWAIGAESYLDV